MTIFLLQRYYKFLIYTNNSSKKFTLFFQALKSPYDDLCILIKYSYIRNVRIKISSIQSWFIILSYRIGCEEKIPFPIWEFGRICIILILIALNSMQLKVLQEPIGLFSQLKNRFSSVTDGTKKRRRGQKPSSFFLSHWPDSAALVSLAY